MTTPSPTPFAGFSREGLALLTELGSHDKAWLDERRDDYEAEIAAPAKAFVTAMGEALAESVSPAIVAIARVNGSISPINNDIRFSPGSAPYKDHLLLRFWEGDDKRTAPTLFLRVSQDEVGFATGHLLADVDRWRAAVDDERSGSALVEALDDLRRGRHLDVVGNARKRVPAPYAPDHPRGDLLKHRSFQARWSEPSPTSITRASFVGWCARRLERCATVHRWLVDELG